MVVAQPDISKTESNFWNESRDALLRRLHASAQGLNKHQARQRLAQFGPNVLREHRERALLLQFLWQFRNPLVLILLLASAVSAVTGEIAGSLIIWCIVLFSVTLDFIQQYRAGQSAERLKQSVAVHAAVLRDGARQSVPASALAPGDVVLLAAGDLIPADCRLLEARDFFINQSLLTGESYPVEKHARELAHSVDELSQAENAVFMGTSVISGSAAALVCRTGGGTALGNISSALQFKSPPNAFELGAQRFGMLIMRLTFMLVLFVFLVNAIQHRPLIESFLFALALAVGLTPELLPMVVTVTLSRGAMRMARQQVIVKQLSAIHNLGSMDVLCTDKTGTLTEGRIKLERHVDAHGKESEQVLQWAYLNSYFETGIRSPLDEAILAHAEIQTGAWRKIDEVPFDFERRRVSVLLEQAGRRMLVVKGAPEDILKLATHYADGEAENILDEGVLSGIHTLQQEMERQGFRVLGIAWRAVSLEHQHAVVDDESELVFAGFAAFLDPPKTSAMQAVSALNKSGVNIKILTGDGELVTRHVCAELQIPVTGVLNGSELQQLNDQALAVRVQGANVLCRLTPQQKNRVILTLKAQGHTVGYLGDGINDAPSLHSADVGISVEGAVDVAKEAASLVLLKQDLNVLHLGVMEGRRTFANIMKYIMMGTSSNFGNMFSMAGATLFLEFLPMLPVQILLNNLLYDISELPIPMDRVDKEYLEHPRHWDMNFIRNFMWVVGPVSSLFDFLTFFILIQVFAASEALFHTGWFIESIASQVLVIFVIRTRSNPLHSKPGKLLWRVSLAVVLIAALLPFMPFAGYLGFVAPPALFYLILPLMVLAYLLAVEAAKRYFYRRYALHGSG